MDGHPVEKQISPEIHEVKLYHEGEGPHHNPALERNFSFWSCLGLAFAILNSWNGRSCTGGHGGADSSYVRHGLRRSADPRAASMSVALPSGGSIAMVWGLPVSAVGTMLMAVSL